MLCSGLHSCFAHGVRALIHEQALKTRVSTNETSSPHTLSSIQQSLQNWFFHTSTPTALAWQSSCSLVCQLFPFAPLPLAERRWQSGHRWLPRTPGRVGYYLPLRLQMHMIAKLAKGVLTSVRLKSRKQCKTPSARRRRASGA